VKFIKNNGNRSILQLGRREKDLLLHVLQFYPVLDPAFQPLTKSEAATELQTHQEFLTESLAEHQQDNRAALRRVLGSSSSLREAGQGWHLSLSPVRIEILLQVLNDIRVGSWRNLGCPEPSEITGVALSEANLRNLYAMETSGYLQIRLLEALEA
jgi:hypothetical protein